MLADDVRTDNFTVRAIRPKGLGGYMRTSPLWARRFFPKTRRIAARRESPL